MPIFLSHGGSASPLSSFCSKMSPASGTHNIEIWSCISLGKAIIDLMSILLFGSEGRILLQLQAVYVAVALNWR